jgi:endonuclease-3
MTIHVVRTLFSKIKTPAQLQALDIVTLEHLIKRIGFYKTKARTLHAVTEQIITSYKSKVPNSYDRLTAIKGVGPKTANLVLGIAFGQPAICVDIHVHRISNRFGLITTQSPQQTIVALENILDKKDWIEWNKLLVMWGQNVCTPISPKCNSCPLTHYCKRTGVKTHR